MFNYLLVSMLQVFTGDSMNISNLSCSQLSYVNLGDFEGTGFEICGDELGSIVRVGDTQESSLQGLVPKFDQLLP